MKIFIAILAFVTLSQSAFAVCSLSFPKPQRFGMGDGLVGEKSFEKMIRILERKGYEVKTDRASRSTADYVLELGTYFGYDCGTGLTWVDYMLVPAGFRVHLSLNRGNVLFERERDYAVPFGVGAKTLAKTKLYRAIKAIPSCEK